MQAIGRHYVDPAHAAMRVAELAEHLPNFIDLAQHKPDALQSVMKLSLDEASLRCIADLEAEESDTWEGFTRATQAGSAVFMVASHSNGEVEFRLGDEVARVAAIGPSMQNDAITWLDALYLAMICRDQVKINFLAGVSPEVVRAANLDYDEYVYALVRMWQAYWNGADGLVELTLDAMRAADPHLVVQSTPRTVLQVYFPMIEIFYSFILRDGSKFNETLIRAFELHREFWGRDEESAVHPRGFVALGLLALACHAKDMGLAIDVATDYMPECLLNGTHIAERPF